MAGFFFNIWYDSWDDGWLKLLTNLVVWIVLDEYTVRIRLVRIHQDSDVICGEKWRLWWGDDYQHGDITPRQSGRETVKLLASATGIWPVIPFNDGSLYPSAVVRRRFEDDEDGRVVNFGPGPPLFKSEGGAASGADAVQVRTEFPETWLWSEVISGYTTSFFLTLGEFGFASGCTRM